MKSIRQNYLPYLSSHTTSFNRIFLIIFIINCTIYINGAAQPAVSLQHCFGGSLDDAGLNLTPTRDHGFLLVGVTESNDFDVSIAHGLNDVWLIRLDSSFNPLWKKSYGGSLDEEGTSAVQTSDEGFIIIANTESNDGDVSGYHDNGDVWIFKIDSLGNLLWQQCFGGTEYESGLSVMLNSTNHIIVTGTTLSADGDLSANYGFADIFVLKLNSNGSLVWVKTFGGSDDEAGYQAVEINNNSILIAGNTYSDDFDVSSNYGSSDVWLLNIDSSGTLLWEETYGGPDNEITTNISILKNGFYFFTAVSNSFTGSVTGNHGNNDFWTVIIDSSSNSIYKEICFGGTNSDTPFRVLTSNSDSIIITGYSNSNNGDLTNNNGDFDAWILCIDTGLNLKWQKSLGGSMEDSFTAIAQEGPNSLLCIGYTYSNDSDVVGNHSANKSDTWLVKLDDISLNQKNDILISENFNVFPNPTTEEMYLVSRNIIKDCNIEIKNIFGQKVYSTVKTLYRNLPLSIPAGLPSGYYLMNLYQNSKIIFSTKFLIQ